MPDIRLLDKKTQPDLWEMAIQMIAVNNGNFGIFATYFNINKESAEMFYNTNVEFRKEVEERLAYLKFNINTTAIKMAVGTLRKKKVLDEKTNKEVWVESDEYEVMPDTALLKTSLEYFTNHEYSDRPTAKSITEQSPIDKLVKAFHEWLPLNLSLVNEYIAEREKAEQIETNKDANISD